MAILPLHVSESHVAVTDTLMTFWTLLTLLFAQRLARDPSYRHFALTGLCLGLAVGSKYTAALVGIAPLAALWLDRPPPRRLLAGLLLLGAISLLACFAVTPFSFLRFPDLLKAMAHENAHVHGHHAGFSVPAVGWQFHRYVYQLCAAWPFSFGFVLYASVLAGTAWLLVRLRREYVPSLLFVAMFFGVTGSWTFTPLRYYLPVVVLGAVFAGLWHGAWWQDPTPARRRTVRWAAGLAAVYTLIFTVTYEQRFRDDTRIQAARWFHEHLRPGQVVHIYGWSRYASVPQGSDGPFVGHPEAELDRTESLSTNDYIEVSSLNYLRWIRHGNTGLCDHYQHLDDPDYFQRVALFDQTFLDRHLYGKFDPMFRSYFLSPTIKIYRRAAAAHGPVHPGAAAPAAHS